MVNFPGYHKGNCICFKNAKYLNKAKTAKSA